MFSQRERLGAAAESKALAIRTHVPIKGGFQALNPGQFTYFASAGARETFGMPCAEFVTLVSKFCDAHQEPAFDAIFSRLKRDVEKMAQDLRTKQAYASHIDIAIAVVNNTGHIPIMLSRIFPATIYKRSARSLQSRDVSAFFSDVLGAAEQGREYLVKHDMTIAVRDCLRELYQLRYDSESDRDVFYACNRVILALFSEVIDKNRETMPKDCAQFDLFSTFVENIHRLVNQSDSKIIPRKNLDNILDIINRKNGMATFEAHKKTSDELYAFLQDMITTVVGVPKDGSDVALTPDQDKKLQALLPFVAYLNSESNPFARAGLFGKEVGSAFIAKALEEYAAHESKETWKHTRYEYHYEAPTNPTEFDEDQIDRLLDGPAKDSHAPAAAGGMFASLTATLRGLLTDSATASSATHSDTDRRNEMLALPMPAKYLAIMPPQASDESTFQKGFQ